MLLRSQYRPYLALQQGFNVRYAETVFLAFLTAYLCVRELVPVAWWDARDTSCGSLPTARSVAAGSWRVNSFRRPV